MTSSDARKVVNRAIKAALEQRGWKIDTLQTVLLHATCDGLDVTIVTSIFAEYPDDVAREAHVSVHSHRNSALQMNFQSRSITDFSPQSVDKLANFVATSLEVFIAATAERVDALASELEAS